MTSLPTMPELWTLQATSLPRALRLHKVLPAAKRLFAARGRFAATGDGFDFGVIAGLAICTPPGGTLAVSKISDFMPCSTVIVAAWLIVGLVVLATIHSAHSTVEIIDFLITHPVEKLLLVKSYHGTGAPSRKISRSMKLPIGVSWIFSDK